MSCLPSGSSTRIPTRTGTATRLGTPASSTAHLHKTPVRPPMANPWQTWRSIGIQQRLEKRASEKDLTLDIADTFEDTVADPRERGRADLEEVFNSKNISREPSKPELKLPRHRPFAIGSRTARPSAYRKKNQSRNSSTRQSSQSDLQINKDKLSSTTTNTESSNNHNNIPSHRHPQSARLSTKRKSTRPRKKTFEDYKKTIAKGLSFEEAEEKKLIRPVNFGRDVPSSEANQKLQKTLQQLRQLWLKAETRGGLSEEEFVHTLQDSWHLSTSELTKLFKKMDCNGDGTLTWDEYLSFVLEVTNQKWQIRSQKGTWELVDTDEPPHSFGSSKTMVHQILVLPSDPLLDFPARYVLNNKDDRIMIMNANTMTSQGYLPLETSERKVKLAPWMEEAGLYLYDSICIHIILIPYLVSCMYVYVCVCMLCVYVCVFF